jgi:TRAP-type C4-dicarboxylate transport system permease small subunit
MGAIVAIHERAHLGTDMLVAKLPVWGKKLCLGLSYVLMLYICWLLYEGALAQVKINWDSTSAAMETSMAIFYGCGVVFAVSGGVILLAQLWQLLSGQIADAALVNIQESEEATHGAGANTPH